jgi:hypothetical protein
MSTLSPILLGATIGLVGTVLFILRGKGESGGSQTPAEHVLRTRVGTRIAFVYLGVLGIATPIASILLASAEATLAMGLALAVAFILAVGARREREKAVADAGKPVCEHG